jgi:hypothetical protein
MPGWGRWSRLDPEHYFNGGGNAHTVAEFNDAAGVNAFHGDWRVWQDPKNPNPDARTKADEQNIGLTYYRKPYGADDAYWKAHTHVLLKDLYHAMLGRENSSTIAKIVPQLRCSP